MISNTALLPWHQFLWKQLQELKNKNRLPSAILISGPTGVGKFNFAQQLIHSLLCTNPNPEGFHCNQCYACGLLEAETHPDWMIIKPETDSSPIKIDVIRDILTFAHQTSSLNAIKAILIHPAHALNAYSANALLKILEEPPRNTYFFLISDHPLLISITIRSRCFHQTIPIPSFSVALEWLSEVAQKQNTQEELTSALHLAQGAPFIALNYLTENHLTTRKKLLDEWITTLKESHSILKISISWNQSNIDNLLTHWISWIADLIRLKQMPHTKNIVNADYLTSLHDLAQSCDLNSLHQFFNQLTQTMGDLKKGAHLNTQLLIESLLINQAGIKIK